MHEDLSYRFRTAGVRGTIYLSDAKVLSDVAYGNAQWTFAIPLSSVSPDPTRVCRTTRAYFICALTALALCFIGVVAIIDHAQFQWNLIFGPMLIGVSFVLAMFAIKYRSEDWIIFPTDSPTRSLAFARSGPDAGRFDEFVQKIMEVVASHHAR